MVLTQTKKAKISDYERNAALDLLLSRLPNDAKITALPDRYLQGRFSLYESYSTIEHKGKKIGVSSFTAGIEFSIDYEI